VLNAQISPRKRQIHNKGISTSVEVIEEIGRKKVIRTNLKKRLTAGKTRSNIRIPSNGDLILPGNKRILEN
jgi:hypothetical protein